MSWEERLDDFEAKPTRTTAKWTVRGWVIVVLVIALAAVTTAVLWGLRVATSDVKGQGDAEIIKNEARNRIRAQEGFEKLYADIQAADRNLTTTASALRAKPTGDLKLETELLGQKHYCAGLVADYNAKARSFTQQDFRAADLPQKIDQSTATEDTDCEEKK
jgi:hypothetical protein